MDKNIPMSKEEREQSAMKLFGLLAGRPTKLEEEGITVVFSPTYPTKSEKKFIQMRSGSRLGKVQRNRS